MTEEELRAELAYWTAEKSEYFIWYFTEEIERIGGRKMKLYEIKRNCLQDLQTWWKMARLKEDAIADTLESIEGEFEDKADNIACLIKTFDAEVEAIKAEEKNLKERRERKEKTSRES